MIDRITEQPFCQTRVSGSTFVNADCFDVFPFIEDKSIDAIICDLPYGTTACKWDSVLPFDKLWKEYSRVIKPNGAIVLFGSEPFSSIMRMSNLKNYKYDWIWNKKNSGSGLLAKKQPLIALTAVVFLFSLTGIPLTAGFQSKFFMLMAAIENGNHFWIVIIAVLFAAVRKVTARKRVVLLAK